MMYSYLISFSFYLTGLFFYANDNCECYPVKDGLTSYKGVDFVIKGDSCRVLQIRFEKSVNFNISRGEVPTCEELLKIGVYNNVQVVPCDM